MQGLVWSVLVWDRTKLALYVAGPFSLAPLSLFSYWVLILFP